MLIFNCHNRNSALDKCNPNPCEFNAACKIENDKPKCFCPETTHIQDSLPDETPVKCSKYLQLDKT